MIQDERIGRLMKNGGLGRMPKRYVDGTLFSLKENPSPTVYRLTGRYYCLLPIQQARLSLQVKQELMEIIREGDEDVKENDLNIEAERDEAVTELKVYGANEVSEGSAKIVRRKQRRR